MRETFSCSLAQSRVPAPGIDGLLMIDRKEVLCLMVTTFSYPVALRRAPRGLLSEVIHNL